MKLEVKPGTIGLMMAALQLVDNRQLKTNKKSGSSFFIQDLSKDDLQIISKLLTEAAIAQGMSVQCIAHEVESETSGLTLSKE